MNLKDILSISGKPGLYKFVSQAKNGIIVESIADQKRIPAYATDKVSSLDEIAIFTESGEVKLSEVFDKISDKVQGGQTISPKTDPAKLKDYFSGILPEYDHDRVYVSDIKKVFSWYNQLQEHNMLIPSEPEEKKVEEEKIAPDKASEAKSEDEAIA